MPQWSRVTSGTVLGDQDAPGRWVFRGRDCTSRAALPGGGRAVRPELHGACGQGCVSFR